MFHASSSRQDLEQLLTHRRVGVYAGIDPTAPSMHVGHMIPFMVLAWFYVHGYDTHFVVSTITPDMRAKQTLTTPSWEASRPVSEILQGG